MRATTRAAAIASAVLAGAAILLASPRPTPAPPPRHWPTGPAHPLCAIAPVGQAACHALLRTDIKPLAAAAITPNATPAGFGPADLQSAYALPSASAGSGQTIAIVDAFNDPTAEADLGVYRSQFGCPRAPLRTDASARLTRTAAPASRVPIPGGPRRSRWTWTWPRPSAPIARSYWLRRARRPLPTWARPRTGPPPGRQRDLQQLRRVRYLRRQPGCAV